MTKLNLFILKIEKTKKYFISVKVIERNNKL